MLEILVMLACVLTVTLLLLFGGRAYGHEPPDCDFRLLYSYGLITRGLPPGEGASQLLGAAIEHWSQCKVGYPDPMIEEPEAVEPEEED